MDIPEQTKRIQNIQPEVVGRYTVDLFINFITSCPITIINILTRQESWDGTLGPSPKPRSQKKIF